MKSLIHISDLHFGRIDRQVVNSLSDYISASAPHLLVVSGDLTQRARPNQFKEAQEFLQSINCNKIVVPGNHDVPLFHIYDRWVRPFNRYQKYIEKNLCPSFVDDSLYVQGLNTAHGWTVAGGKLSHRALEKVAEDWQQNEKVRILVTHHPFEITLTEKPVRRWGYRSVLPYQTLLQAEPDILLAGHWHHGSSSLSSEVLKTPHRNMICVQAGTATSTRRRHEVNTFNHLLISKEKIEIRKMHYSENSGTFEQLSKEFFLLEGGSWRPASDLIGTLVVSDK